MATAVIKSLTVQAAAQGIFGLNLQSGHYYESPEYVDENLGKTVVTIKFTPPSRVDAGMMPSVTITAKEKELRAAYVNSIDNLYSALEPVVVKFLSPNVSERGGRF